MDNVLKYEGQIRIRGLIFELPRAAICKPGDAYIVDKAFEFVNKNTRMKVYPHDVLCYTGVDTGWVVLPKLCPIKVIYVIGQSNSGKDTLKKQFMDLLNFHVSDFEKEYNIPINHTNRPARKNERYGIDYYFEDYSGKEICENFEKNESMISIDNLDTSDFNVLSYSSFTVANGDEWTYWTTLQDLDLNKINIIFGDPLMFYLLNKDRTIYIGEENYVLKKEIIKLDCKPSVILERALKRCSNEPLKEEEMIRRFTSDQKMFCDFMLAEYGIKNYHVVKSDDENAFKDFLIKVDECKNLLK